MTRRTPKEAPEAASIGSLLALFQPVISTVIMTAGLVVWAFNTFAQLSYVEKQYTEIKANQDAIKKLVFEQEEKVKADAHAYSDGNREKLLPAVVDLKESIKEVKDSVRSLESKLLMPIGRK